jgi:hypothetical protein
MNFIFDEGLIIRDGGGSTFLLWPYRNVIKRFSNTIFFLNKHFLVGLKTILVFE